MFKFAFIAGALLLGLLACTDNQSPSSQPVTASGSVAPAAPASLSRVLETFEIGEDVYARALAIDATQQSLWVGTSVGVHEIDLSSYQVKQTLTRDNGLANEYVFAVHIDQRGRKWFGTNGGGVSRYDNKDWQTFFPMHGLADYWVYAFAEQASGALWIGTWAGVNRVDPDSGQFTTHVKALINEWVYGIDVDAQDRVWFGTEGGVSMYNGKRWQAWNHDDGLGAQNSAKLPISSNTGLGTRSRHDLSVIVAGQNSYNPNYVFSVHVAADGTVLAGTWGGGVSRFDGKHWSNLTTRDGLAGNIVFSIAEGPEGVLWFGTDQGVSRYDGQSWQTISSDQGLFDDHVYALAITAAGEVWAGTRGAVARIGASLVE